MNKRAPSFATDAGVWRRVIQKISEAHGDFEDWDQKSWAAASMYYRRAAAAQGGTKYTTGERIAYIRPDGEPVVSDGGRVRADLGPAKECPSCEKVAQFYDGDYMCHTCRDEMECSG